MTPQEVEAFYEGLATLTESGKEDDVRELVAKNFQRLPENVRNEILFSSFAGAVKDELDEEKAVTEIQEKGIAAARALEAQAQIEDAKKDEAGA